MKSQIRRINERGTPPDFGRKVAASCQGKQKIFESLFHLSILIAQETTHAIAFHDIIRVLLHDGFFSHRVIQGNRFLPFFPGCQNGRFHGNSHFPITISCRFTALHRLFRLQDGFVAVFHAMLIFPDSITCLGCDKQSGNPDIRILYFLCNIQQFSDFPVQ